MKTITRLLLLLAVIPMAYSQVGIGTTNPDPSAMLEVQSTEHGLLIPRMTTVQRNNISSPAESLFVYDTDEDAFFYYDTASSSWIRLLADDVKRDNYKLVKSVADLSDELVAGGGSRYLLDENTYYEINGVIALAAPIDLNNAYIAGLDAQEDVLTYSGTVFQGSTGGSIKNITITGGGTAFNISGPGISSASTLLLQNTVVAGMANVGTISGLGLYFTNIVQFTNNTTGITYSNIGNLLLNNQAWLGNNAGTYETLTGTFGLVEKVSGFSSVASGATGLNVSGNPTVTNGIINGTAFSGSGTYVNGYSPAPFNGYNFTRNWFINCPGIPRESDDVAGGNFYYNGSLTTGFTQSISNGTAVKVEGTGNTVSNDLFRFTATGNNRLTYVGNKRRNFQVNVSMSIRVTSAAGDFYAFLLAKNGTVVTESNAIVRIDSDSEIQNVAINSIVTMNPGDYIEIFTQRFNGGGTDTLVVFSENLSIK